MHYGCKDPKALNYEQFAAHNPILCKYQNIIPIFSRDLKLGMRGEDVKRLQQYLNTHGYQLSTTGLGSPGNETNYFGNLTKQAVIKFQKAKNITPTVGYFGPKTRGEVR